LGVFLWLLAPIGVSFALRFFAKDGWRDLGIKPALKSNIGLYLISFLAYPVVILLVLVIGVAFNFISFISLSAEKYDLFLKTIGVTVVPCVFYSIFEEFGWRGYMTPKIQSLGISALFIHFIVGVVWAAWHLPFINYITSYTSESLVSYLPRFFFGCIVAAFVYGEIRILTGSVWPAFLMHFSGNVFANPLVSKTSIIEISAGKESIGSPGIDGLIVIALFAVLGLGLYLYRKRRGLQRA